MSADVTEPYSASVSPTLRVMTTSTPLIRAAMASARVFLFRFFRVELHALALDLLQVARRREQRQLARQQIVARVAVGDLHHFAALPDVLDVISQNDFHKYLFSFGSSSDQLLSHAANSRSARSSAYSVT